MRRARNKERELKSRTRKSDGNSYGWILTRIRVERMIVVRVRQVGSHERKVGRRGRMNGFVWEAKEGKKDKEEE